MTTTVTVNAHCDPKTTVVEVLITDDISDGEQTLLEDGESVDFVVYDNREITVKEVPK